MDKVQEKIQLGRHYSKSRCQQLSFLFSLKPLLAVIFVWEWSLFGKVALLFWNCGAPIRWILCCDFWPQSISFDVQTGMQLYLILSVFRLKILCSAWPFGNSLSRIFRKDCPTLVGTFLLKGRLYQKMSLWRFLLPEFPSGPTCYSKRNWQLAE